MELGDQGTKDGGGRRTRSGDDDKQQRPESDGSDDEGTRQPYNCTFCRRGFPTAQALGGHMNIHRKDRGRASTVAEISLPHTERPAALPPQELRLFEYGNVAAAADRGKGQGGGRDRWKCYVSKDGDRPGEEEELDLELRLGSAAGQ